MKSNTTDAVLPARLLALAIALSTVALVLFSVPTSSVRAAPKATTWHVTKLADTNDGVCNGDCSLREANGVASNGDTIDFPSLSGTIVLSSTFGPLDISNNIGIVGPGAANLAVSGNNAVLVFAIHGNVTLSGMTIRDGNGGGDNGGGISNNGSLTLTSVSVIGNTANGSAGIYNNGGKLILISTLVANNIATANGGGVLNNGPTSSLIMSGSTISGNVATSGVGGGIINGGSMTITNGIISNNQSGGNGAGIWNASSTTVAMTNSTVKDNMASGVVGGGIYNEGTMAITNTTVSNNVISSTISSGGGIFNTGIVTLTNTTLNGNTSLGASNSNGGAIYMEVSSSVLTMNNVTISGNSSNSANAVAGGIHVANGTANLNNVTITKNSAGNLGGGVAMYGVAFNFKNTIIAGNTASDGPDCKTGTILNSQDYNLIGDSTGCTIGGTTVHNLSGDPKLTPLAYLGGPTQVHGLISGSPALNAGNNATCLATDQRGVARALTVGNPCDIGAFEGIATALYLPLILR